MSTRTDAMSQPPRFCAAMVDFGVASIHPTSLVMVVGWVERSETHQQYPDGGGQ
jgi:hypothetical protein